MNIHHIGYAVKDIIDATNKFMNLGFYKFGSIIEDEKRNVLIQFIKNEGYTVELISPYKKELKSPVDTILSKNKMSMPYHICYEVDNLYDKIKELKMKGYMVIEEENEAKAIDFRKVAFLYNMSVGIIELVEK